MEPIGNENNKIEISKSPPNGTSALKPNQVLESTSKEDTLEPSCVENDETLNLNKNSEIQTSENEPSQVLESTRNESKERLSFSLTTNISPITMKPMNQSEIKELIKQPSEKLFDFSEDVFDDSSKPSPVQDLASKVTVSNSKPDDSTSKITGSSCSGTENELFRELYEEIDKEKDPDFLPSDVEKNEGKAFFII